MTKNDEVNMLRSTAIISSYLENYKHFSEKGLFIQLNLY